MRQIPWIRTAAATLALVGAIAGCKSNQNKPPQVPAVVVKPKIALDPQTLGDVSGIVRLVGKAPEPVKIDTTMDPACSVSSSGLVYTQQYAVQGDRIANVYIYIKSGPPAAMQGGPERTQPVVIDQKGCTYVPHVVAVEVGEPVEFLNSDPTMHNVHTLTEDSGNPGIDISQGPHGKPQFRTFSKPEQMIPVRCNNHPWMNAFINVSATPWFAVTGPDGKFELKGLPAGDYTLGAVQEKLGEQEIKITVKPKAATQADFTFAIKK